MALSIKSQDLEKYYLIQVGLKFNVTNASEVRDAIEEAMRIGRKQVLMDLSGVAVMDSTAMGTIVKYREKLHEMGGRLDLVAPPSNIQKLLTSCGLDKVLKIYKSLMEADRILRAGIVKEDHGFYVLFKVPKEFNITTVNSLRPAIQKAKQQGYKQFVFDFFDNHQITSVGIGILVNLHKELSAAGGGVHLVRLEPEVHSLLESTNVLTQLPAYAKIEDVDEKLVGSAT